MQAQFLNNLEANKQTVREFYETAFNEHKPEEAAVKYLGRTYRQHNPTIASGAEPFIGFVKNFIKAYPALNPVKDLKPARNRLRKIDVAEGVLRSPPHGERGERKMKLTCLVSALLGGDLFSP